MENLDSNIQYPCKWDYLIITTNKDFLKTAIKDNFGMLEYNFTFSKESKQGKYLSFIFSIQVANQKQRDEIFNILTKINYVKVVI